MADPKALVTAAFQPHMAQGAKLTMREEGDKLIVTIPDPALNNKLVAMRDTKDQARLDKYFQATGGEATPEMNIGPANKGPVATLEFSRKELAGLDPKQAAVLLQQEVGGMLADLGHGKINAPGAAVAQGAEKPITRGGVDVTRMDPKDIPADQLSMAIACFKPQPGKRRGTEGPEVRATEIAYHPSGNLKAGTHVSPSSGQSALPAAPDCPTR